MVEHGIKLRHRWAPLAVLLLTACTTQGAPGPASPTPTAPPTASPTATPLPSPTATSTPPFDVLLEGDAVTGFGNLLESPTGAVTLCPMAVRTLNVGPGLVGCAKHTMVEVTGLDVHVLQGGQEINYWVSEYARVTGTWSEGAIRASSTQPADRPPAVGHGKVPCPTPSDGWPDDEISAAFEEAHSRLEATIAGSPDEYSGVWVARIGDTLETALVVGTLGDVESSRAELTAIYPYSLCVIAAEFSAAELQSVDDELKAAGGPWQSNVYPWINRVNVETAVLDAAAVEALAPYADMISMDVTVQRAP